MAGNITPMMRQYVEMKERYSDCLLFFRLGDFYEMFFEDAKTASRELELTLTGRDCGLSERAPMCGVPYHSVDNYINRLIEKGYKVAICEQLQDPALAKGLVERDVIRVITPGTVIEEKMLEQGENCFIAAILYDQEEIGVAYADVSTGAFFCFSLTGKNADTQLLDELARIRPREVLANPAFFMQQFLSKHVSSLYYLESCPEQSFVQSGARARLLAHFKVNSLASYGIDKLPYMVSACGALMQYLEETQKNSLSHIHRITMLNRGGYMLLDSATRRNLELTAPIRQGGSRKNTLLYLLDSTQTAMGGRMLRDWVERPLLSGAAIEERLDAVEELQKDLPLRRALCEQLSGIYDIERLCSRIVYGSVNARDCVALRNTLARFPALTEALSPLSSEANARIRDTLDLMEDVLSLLCAAISEEPPIGVKEGGMIRSGFHAEVDELRAISTGSKDWLARFESSERERSKIKNLRVGYNRVFGYYIEVTKSYLPLVPYDYERKQTLANAERFITPALKEMEQKILGAEERLITLEYELFCTVREQLLACTERMQEDARLLAELDCYQSLAQAASANRYCRPKLNTEGRIRIQEGRHPVIERSQQESFVPNDVLLDNGENRLLIITGPNMAGKSTYMRQTALITLMAHIGSFVPASEADISIVDRIFTRIGASDDLSAGQSTFMVEMNEMANIINNATSNSLLVLDEIGRGTSTFDGLSIAWAVLEYIASDKGCAAKTLFATHYHELTELEGKLPGVKNYSVSVREIGEDIVFLRRILRGGADKSFGVQVARLAGLPSKVLERAKEILAELEAADIAVARREHGPVETSVQCSLFDDDSDSDALGMLRALDPDKLTPREALNQLYILHDLAQGGGERHA